MEFEKVYNDVLQYYPSDIDISDEKIISDINGFDSLNSISSYDEAEKIASLAGKWQSLITWVIYQVLHETAIIQFAKEKYPNDPGKSVANADGSKRRPAQVGLAHELGHAKDGIEGKVTKARSIVRDPDDNARVYMTNDEIMVRKNIDNPIRKEQGAKPRALPVIIP